MLCLYVVYMLYMLCICCICCVYVVVVDVDAVKRRASWEVSVSPLPRLATHGKDLLHSRPQLPLPRSGRRYIDYICLNTTPSAEFGKARGPGRGRSRGHGGGDPLSIQLTLVSTVSTLFKYLFI